MKRPYMLLLLPLLVAGELCVRQPEQAQRRQLSFPDGNTESTTTLQAAERFVAGWADVGTQREQVHDWFQVLDPAGNSVEGATVVFFDGWTVTDRRTTNADGMLDLCGVKVHTAAEVVKAGYAVKTVSPEQRSVRLPPLRVLAVRAVNMPDTLVEDWSLLLCLQRCNSQRHAWDAIEHHGMLHPVPLRDRVARIPLPFQLTENPSLMLFGQHRITGRVMYLESLELRLQQKDAQDRVVIDLSDLWAAKNREWILAKVHLPDSEGGVFGFCINGCDSRLSAGRSESGDIPVGASTVDVFTCCLSAHAAGEPSLQPGISVYRSNASYNLPLTEVRVGESHYVELWPRPCTGVLEIEIERHPDVPADEQLELSLCRGHGHHRPRSMWRDPSQTLADRVVRVSWLPTSTYRLWCKSKSGMGLSIRVETQEHRTTRVRMPIAPEAELKVRCTDSRRTGELRVVHVGTGNAELGWGLTEIHKVPSHLYLPVGRYRLTFTDRWGRVQQETVELKRPESVVRF